MLIHCYYAVSKFCNLRCKYCYLPAEYKQRKDLQDSEVLKSSEKFITKLKRENIRLGSVCLHGAEPLTLRSQTVLQLLSKFYRITQKPVSIQTNGTLLTPGYLSALIPAKKYVVLSVSIDGPPVIHDKLRGNTYHRIWKHIQAAKKLGFTVRLLVGLSQQTLKHRADFLSWLELLKNKNIPFKFKLIHAQGGCPLDLNPIQQRVLGKWLQLHGYSKNSQLANLRICSNQGNQCNWYEFSVDGSVYSCNNQFMPGKAFGNWKQETFYKIIRSRKKLYKDVPVSTQCQDCDLFNFCHSGCPLTRTKRGLSGDCNFRRALFLPKCCGAANCNQCSF